MTQVRLAETKDMTALLKYDSHLPHTRINECLWNGRIYVLCQEKEVVGVLRYSLFWQTIPFLEHLYIDESSRAKGLGRLLMAYWEAAMQTMGFPYAMLSTQEDETAKFFYEKLGYRQIGAFLPPEQEARELMYLKTL